MIKHLLSTEKQEDEFALRSSAMLSLYIPGISIHYKMKLKDIDFLIDYFISSEGVIPHDSFNR